MKISEMNQTQKVAFQQVVNATDWILGGYENSLSDGQIDKMPSHDELKDLIYDQVVNCTTFPGCLSTQPIHEVKFCGKDWLLERIDRRLAKFGY